MKVFRITTIVAAVAAAFIASPAFAHEGEKHRASDASHKHAEHAKDGAPGVPKDYPLKKCVVSNEPLGEHGKVVKVSHDGTDVYLCCKDCSKDFNKDPQKYVKMVKDAQAHAHAKN